MTTAADICYDAALSVNAVQLGEPLTDAEAQVVLRCWQRLIDSVGLDRSNIHTVRKDSYLIRTGQDAYTFGYDPRVPTNQITAASNATAAVLTLTSAHGIPVGRTSSVYIQNGAGDWQVINGGFIATALSTTTVSIPVNSTSFTTLTGDNVILQVAGELNYVRPNRITRINLDWGNGFLTHLRRADSDQWAEITLPNLTGPPNRYYNDENAPLSTLNLYPIPNREYTAIVYSEQALEQPLALSDEVVFSQGYARYWIGKLGIEAAPFLSVKAGAGIMSNAAEAEALVKGKNRRSPALESDPSLTGGHDLYDDARWSGLHS